MNHKLISCHIFFSSKILLLHDNIYKLGAIFNLDFKSQSSSNQASLKYLFLSTQEILAS